MKQIDSLQTGKKFKKTEIGEIPVDWEVKTLINAVGEKRNLIVAGPFGSNLQVKDYKGRGVPIIRLQNIDYCRFIEKNIKYISIDKADELNYHSFIKGDIILAKLGTPIGKTCIVPKSIEGGIVVADVVRIRVDNEYSNKHFIMYVLNSSYGLNQLTRETIGTTRPRVNLNKVRNLKIPFPPVSEQKKIAEILSALDELIEKKFKIVEKKKQLKKGLMQQLLTRGIGHAEFKKTEIGDIPVDWEVYSIGKLSQIRRGASPRPIGDLKYFGDGPGWIRISDVTKSNIFLRETEDHLSELGVSKSVKVKPGDLIMSICATIGRPIIVEIDACIHDGFVLFDKLSDKINTLYLLFWIKKNEERFAAKGQLGTQKNLNTSIIKNTKIPLPSLTEQKKIALILSAIDTDIEQELAYKKRLDTIKMGLMQILLTGKVRVKV